MPDPQEFVRWFRNSAPYINAFRGRTFVIAFGGELLADAQFPGLVHDLALLHSLGVRLVLVHGARPQIEERMRARGVEMRYEQGVRITDPAALACVKEAAGVMRMEIEALLSMGLANSPMAGADIRVASGNFVTAQPLGVREGVDFLHTGEVRSLDAAAIGRTLDSGAIVVLSPVGYSPTGEIFNLSLEDVATAAAIHLRADKLVYLVDAPGFVTGVGELVRELAPNEADTALKGGEVAPAVVRPLASAVTACRKGLRRAHLISRHVDGALLMELFTRDGIGTLVTSEAYQGTRQATIADVGGILELIRPLEEEGVLVRRSRELLEREIDHFVVNERDGTIIACSALYPYPQEEVGEVACMAVHPEYRNQGKGDELLKYMERQARGLGIRRLFVLTTRTAHWFQERGFVAGEIQNLPVARQLMYNYQRRSKVFIKAL